MALRGFYTGKTLGNWPHSVFFYHNLVLNVPSSFLLSNLNLSPALVPTLKHIPKRKKAKLLTAFMTINKGFTALD